MLSQVIVVAMVLTAVVVLLVGRGTGRKRRSVRWWTRRFGDYGVVVFVDREAAKLAGMEW